MPDHPSIIKKLSDLDGRKLKFKTEEDGTVFIYDMQSGGNWLAAVCFRGEWKNGVGGELGESYDVS